MRGSANRNREQSVKEEMVLNLYKKMGIGTQEERNRLLRWVPSEPRLDDCIQTFIIETPNTHSGEEAHDAELARDTE